MVNTNYTVNAVNPYYALAETKNTQEISPQKTKPLAPTYITIDIKNPDEVGKWLNTAKTNIGEILGVIHVTGKLPELSKLTELQVIDFLGKLPALQSFLV